MVSRRYRDVCETVSRCCTVSLAACVVGCAGFALQPYDKIVLDTSWRTQVLAAHMPVERPLNRAARHSGRSQAAIKQRLVGLWEPSRRIDQLLNYNGLLATRYSQLNTQPGPVFRHGSLQVIHLGRPRHIEYIAALHPGRRLPTVVGISGINGTVDGKITVDILQSLYDSGEFHVVHLESVTSVAHTLRNEQPFSGGFPEGLLVYETLAELRAQPEFEGAIEQLHLLGVSFGGMLFGFAAHCEDRFQRGVVDGAVLAFSPPLDLRRLFHNLANFPYIHDRVHQGYLVKGLEGFVRRGIVEVTEDPKQIDFDDYMERIGLPYVKRIYPSLRSKFPDLAPIETKEDLYAISSVRPFLGRLGVPYFYYYAYDDPVLSPGDHFHQALSECANPLVDGILLPDGGHLGYDTISRKPFTSRVALEYFRYWSDPPVSPAAIP